METQKLFFSFLFLGTLNESLLKTAFSLVPVCESREGQR